MVKQGQWSMCILHFTQCTPTNLAPITKLTVMNRQHSKIHISVMCPSSYLLMQECTHAVPAIFDPVFFPPFCQENNIDDDDDDGFRTTHLVPSAGSTNITPHLLTKIRFIEHGRWHIFPLGSQKRNENYSVQAVIVGSGGGGGNFHPPPLPRNDDIPHFRSIDILSPSPRRSRRRLRRRCEAGEKSPSSAHTNYCTPPSVTAAVGSAT